MKKYCQFIYMFLLVSSTMSAQLRVDSVSLINNTDLVPINVQSGQETYMGIKSVKVIGVGKETEARFVKINNYEFKDGIIELDISGKPAGNSTEGGSGICWYCI